MRAQEARAGLSANLWQKEQTGADVSKQLESVKHLLWHGNTEEALERLGDLLAELSFTQARSNAAKKVVDNLSEF